MTHYQRWRRGYHPAEDHSQGENHCRAKLTTELVQQIRDRAYYDKTPNSELAEKFGVSRSTISGIIRRVTWTHI